MAEQRLLGDPRTYTWLTQVWNGRSWALYESSPALCGSLVAEAKRHSTQPQHQHAIMPDSYRLDPRLGLFSVFGRCQGGASIYTSRSKKSAYKGAQGLLDAIFLSGARFRPRASFTQTEP